MTQDCLQELAPYYDILMSHVNYDRWFTVIMKLAELLPPKFVHLDAACGTGVLLHKLLEQGWYSFGLDISEAMIRQGLRHQNCSKLVVGDVCALPMIETFDIITCLFDSLNFLLVRDDLQRAIKEMARALRPQGILYFDVVTERMILEHFAGKKWTERTKNIITTWESKYHKDSGIVETQITIRNGPASTIREKIYPIEEIKEAVELAGLRLLTVRDAETWGDIRTKSTRVDFIACKGNPLFLLPKMQRITKEIKTLMQ